MSTQAPESSQPSWASDIALVAVLAALCVGPLLVFGWGAPSEVPRTAMLSSVVMVASMLLRRRTPLTMLVLLTAACMVQLVTSPIPLPAVLVVPLASYSVARWVPGRASRLVLLPGLLGSLLGPLRWAITLRSYGAFSGANNVDTATLIALAVMVGLCAGQVLAAYAIGRRNRDQELAGRERVQSAAELRALELAEREQAARTAEARVRAQIARELHDVVAHSLSVMIVQAQGGKAVAAKHPEQAVEALDTIAETGREALSQMRRIVGVLRGAPGEQADFAPSPGLEQIPELVERAGDGRVELVVTGTRPAVPQTLSLVVYRVVQEAVTNFLKHAGPTAHATVQLSYSPALVVVEVLDDGAGSSVVSDGHGNGLQGMRERVQSMGGQLVARPRHGGGFLVRAVLPVADRAPTTGRDAQEA